MESNQIEPGCQIKLASPKTFSQKLYQSKNTPIKPEEILEEYYLHASPESLGKLKSLLEKIYELTN